MELKEFSREEFGTFLENNYKSAIDKVKIMMYCDYPNHDGTLFLSSFGKLRFDSAYLCRKLLKTYDLSYVYFDGKPFSRKWFEKNNWEIN